MNKTNSNLKFKGEPLETSGRELKEGDLLPNFRLTSNDLSDFDSTALRDKVVVLSVVPSLDTPVCSAQAKRFNQEATKDPEIEFIVISRDLPFAQKRWMEESACSKVHTASDYKYRTFGEQFGVELPNIGLLARSIFVANKHGKIIHLEYVEELSEEPDYEAVLKAVRSAL
jgi:thiol peroxidase